MKARFYVEKPEQAEATMVITMTIKAWKQLQQELTHVWPASELSMSISNLVNQAEKHFHLEPE